MKRLQLIIILLCSFAIFYAQKKVECKYYKDFWQSQKTTETKGKYKECTEFENDSVKHITFTNLSTQQVLWEKKYVNDRPVGIWNFYNDNGQLKYQMDYNFTLKYGKFKPEGYYAVNPISHKLLEDGVAGTFEMPEYGTSNKSDVAYWIFDQVRYPIKAQENNIQGKVMIQFTIDANGDIGNISILKGVNEDLDREAFRVFYRIKHVKPGKLNNKEIPLYVECPVNFRIQ